MMGMYDLVAIRVPVHTYMCNVFMHFSLRCPYYKYDYDNAVNAVLHKALCNMRHECA